MFFTAILINYIKGGTPAQILIKTWKDNKGQHRLGLSKIKKEERIGKGSKLGKRRKRMDPRFI
jgi:hypothetical protein